MTCLKDRHTNGGPSGSTRQQSLAGMAGGGLAATYSIIVCRNPILTAIGFSLYRKGGSRTALTRRTAPAVTRYHENFVHVVGHDHPFIQFYMVITTSQPFPDIGNDLPRFISGICRSRGEGRF